MEMKIDFLEPARRFSAGRYTAIEINHCANIALEDNEQVTFLTDSGTELDVARKSWGYYATPSLNGRLFGLGLRAVLVANELGKLYLLLVERGKESDFHDYVRTERQQIVCWLDTDEQVARLRNAVSQDPKDGSE